MSKTIAEELDLRGPGGCGFIHLHSGISQAHLMKAANDFAPVVIIPHARYDLGLRTQGVGMIREVRWGPTQLWSSEK